MKALRALAALTIAAGATLAAAAPALAADDCRATTTTLTNRPDSGAHGDWAVDNLTRVTVVCQTDTAGAYQAEVTDTGNFTTIAGNSPGAGVPLAAGITGTVSGGFTATFTAEPDFADYNGTHDGKTYDGAVHPSGSWVAELFDGGLLSGKGLNGGWAWTYTTCSETWVNADAGNTGDITTVPDCPTTAAPTTAAQTTTTKPAVTTTTTTAAAAAATSAAPSAQAAPELPVTGGSLTAVIIAGVALAVSGVVLIWLGRRRRALADQ